MIMWLQGGPGSSSMLGLFALNGPLSLDENIELGEREITWNKNYSMVYVDNPVGTGKFTGCVRKVHNNNEGFPYVHHRDIFSRPCSSLFDRARRRIKQFWYTNF